MLEKRSREESGGTTPDPPAVRPEDLGIGKLFHSVRDAVIVAEAKTQRIVLWNPAATKMFGYSPSEALELRVEALVPEHLKRRHRAGVARYDETGHGNLIDANEPVELPAVTKEGEEIQVELSLSPISYVHGTGEGARFVLAIIRDITRRKRAEEKLKESEQRFAGSFRDASIGMALVGTDGRWLQVNRALCAIVGYPEEELLRKTFQDITHPDDLGGDLDHLRQLVAGEIETYQVEKRYFHKQGRVVWILLNVSLVRDAQDNPHYFISQIQDVTERKRAEEELRRAYEELDARVRERTAELDEANAGLRTEILGRRKVEERLRESEDRLRLAVETTGLGTWDFDLLTGDVKWDDRCKAMFGLPPEAEVDYEAFLEGLHPDYRELTDQVVQRALDPAGEGEFDMEYRTVGIEDGIERWVASRGQVFFDEAARAVRFIGTVLDITGRKKFEEELRRSENSLLAAQRIARLGNWEYAPREDKVWWSDELYRILGFAPQEFTPTYEEFFGRILHPGNRETVREQIRGALRGEEGASEIDYRVLRPDGASRSVRTRYEVVRDVTGKPVKMIGTIQDITEQRRAEEELAELVEELRRSNVELEQFAYVASHDLQEPLRMVSSYTQLLARRYEGKLDADADEFIGYAVDGANRMRRLITDLLQYSRLGTRSKTLAPVDTGAVFELVRADLRTAIEESGAQVSAGSLPTVMGDETQLVQLFQNLIGNALKFRGEGPPEVRVEAERHNGDWLFTVRDNGIGIEPEYVERIFVIFQRLHNKARYPGTGIGLAMSKKIVERHGGKIWVESGEGSTFFFTLPAPERER